jgi:hypothetical protein
MKTQTFWNSIWNRRVSSSSDKITSSGCNEQSVQKKLPEITTCSGDKDFYCSRHDVKRVVQLYRGGSLFQKFVMRRGTRTCILLIRLAICTASLFGSPDRGLRQRYNWRVRYGCNGGLAHVHSTPMLCFLTKPKMEHFTSKDIPDVWNLPSPRRAIVTGSNAGIGLETARALANKGWHVILATRYHCKTFGSPKSLS